MGGISHIVKLAFVRFCPAPDAIALVCFKRVGETLFHDWTGFAKILSGLSCGGSELRVWNVVWIEQLRNPLAGNTLIAMYL